MRRTLRTGCLAALGLLMLTPSLQPADAGPIDPPPGPVAPTGRTVIPSLPYTIDQPGSYRLTGNLIGTSGITINASNVTLDLEGFTLDGGIGIGTAVHILGQNVTIRNGYVKRWNVGIVGTTSNCVATDIIVTQTGDGSGGMMAGIDVGPRALVARCTVVACNRGIRVGAGSTLLDSRAIGCELDGIIAGDHSRVAGCVATGNGLGSASQIAVGSACVVRDCSVRNGLTTTGLLLGDRSIAAGCSVENAPIIAGSLCLIESCSVNCPALSDTSGAIEVGSGCIVSGCTVLNTSGAAIRVSGDRTAIENNRLTAGEVGIAVVGTGNFIARNKVSGTTTPFDIAPGNAYGQVVNLTSGGVIPVADPWANFVQ